MGFSFSIRALGGLLNTLPKCTRAAQSLLRSYLGRGSRHLRLEEIKPGSRLRGLDPEGVAGIVQVARFGADALNLPSTS
jgi:hypothetical protein